MQKVCTHSKSTHVSTLMGSELTETKNGGQHVLIIAAAHKHIYRKDHLIPCMMSLKNYIVMILLKFCTIDSC